MGTAPHVVKGCSVGRDHTGVGDFYPAEANRELFARLGELGISPVFFPAIGYTAELDKYQEVADGLSLATISGTEMRAAIRSGRPLPDWYMRDIVQEMLLGEIAAGKPVFHN